MVLDAVTGRTLASRRFDAPNHNAVFSPAGDEVWTTRMLKDGAVLVLDLRLIGLWRRISLAAITTPTVPIATVGFAIAATSGIGLLATKATEYVGNPFIYIKFSAIGLGLLNVIALNSLFAWKTHKTRELSKHEQRQLATVGGISLLCWLTAITAGRMIGYW